MTMQSLTASQASPEVPVNENFETLEHAAVYGKRHPTTTGLTWGYYGGRWGGFSVADGTLTLTGSATNHVVVSRADGAISVATASTNWDNTDDYVRVYKLTTSSTAVTAVEDHRAGPGGVHGGGGGNTDLSAIEATLALKVDKLPGISASASTSLTISSATYATHIGKVLRMTSGSAITITLDSLSNGSMPLGTLITVRQAGAGQITFVGSGTGTPPTLNVPAERVAKTRAQGSVVMAHLVDTSGGGTWDMAGDLEAS